ncbi:MAG: N-acetylmuramoyl-L-alanine amidase [Alphaproteobacteria bacterium]|nr:N-acetylmuramoyl-L-alanine amidase [Alphaproteobacteria bacterium]
MLTRIHYPSPNFESRPAGALVDMIILHYTDMTSAQSALDRLCDPEAKVSSHFLISKEGTLYQLVDPVYRAWHAGESSWQGRQDINSYSLGIELDNLGHTFGPEPFPEAQIITLLELLTELTTEYGISPKSILGHSDIAPLRKRDPGAMFPWALLGKRGFGQVPLPTATEEQFPQMTISEVQGALLKIGYFCPQTGEWDEDSQKVCRAFQQHFTPYEVTGHPTNLMLQVIKGLVPHDIMTR